MINIDTSLANSWNRRVYLAGGAGVVAIYLASAIETGELSYLVSGAGFALFLAPLFRRSIAGSPSLSQEDQMLMRQRQVKADRIMTVCLVAGLALSIASVLFRWLS